MLHDRSVVEERGIESDVVRETLLGRLSRLEIPQHSRAMLTDQYRMVPGIGSLISSVFYGGALRNAKSATVPAPIANAFPKPVTWYSTGSEKTRREKQSGSSWINLLEAQWMRTFIRRICFFVEHGDPSVKPPLRPSVVVLTGYAAQKAHIEKVLSGEETRVIDLEVHTVDAYQGREADIVLFSVTRSNERGNPGFLAYRERINVALSRARYALCIVGDAKFCGDLGERSPFADVIRYIGEHGDDCQLKEGNL